MTLDLYLSLPQLVVSSVGQRTVDARLARDGLSRRIATIPSLAGVVPILQHTGLCAVLPELWLKLYSAPGTLATAPLPLGDADFTIDLIWRAQDERDGGHRWLRQLIAEEISTVATSDWVTGGTPSRLDRVPVGTSEAA